MWEKLDEGLITTQDALTESVNYNPDYAKEIQYFYDNAGKALSVQPYTYKFIRALKAKGYTILYLSNWSKMIIDQAPNLLDFLQLTDGGIFSFEEHIVKPNKEIYLLLCERYHLKVEDCLFIDDKQTNVMSAKEVGMQIVRYQRYDQMIQELEQILGTI